ncbi:MAG TPA: T9SS type A sorting domain-containing protein [Bacteroidales bacterium]|nr:T9SS type A sorting domain-containing protein [Bacteroidales bacterium]
MKKNYKKQLLLRRFSLVITLSLLVIFGYSQSITFTSPNSSTSWEIGNNEDIIFNVTTPAINEVNIQLYQGGVYKETIASSYYCQMGENIKNVAISGFGFNPGINYQIVIFNWSDMSTPVATSDNFEIVEATPKITEVSQPSTGYYWQNGTNQYIYWKSWSVDKVDIDYSIDNGDNWINITTNQTVQYVGTNYYLWNISGISGDNPNSKIRVSSSADNSIYKESSIFMLSEFPPYRIINPEEGTSWELGTQQTITINNVSSGSLWSPYLKLYIDNVFQAYIFFNGNLYPGLTNLEWDIPLSYPASDNCKLYLYDDYGSYYSQSDVFELAEPAPAVLSITSPVNESFWANNLTYSIDFNTYGLTQVDIEYTTNGIEYTTIASNVDVNNGDNTYSWSVSGIIGTNSNSRIRISESGNSSNNLSSELFTLAEHTPIYFVDPNITSNWQLGSTQTIKIMVMQPSWEYFNLALYIDGIFVENMPSYMDYNSTGLKQRTWEISTAYNASTNCVLKLVQNNYESTVHAVSETFELSEPPASVLSIESPAEYYYWSNNNSYDIIFNTYGLTEVDIEYTPNGTDYTTIVNNVAVANGENTYNWTVSGITGTNENSQIRISESGNASNNLNSSEFTLSDKPLVEFISPTSSTVFFINGSNMVMMQCQLKLNSGPSYTSVNIKFYIDGMEAENENVWLDEVINYESFWIWDAWPSTNCYLRIYQGTTLITQSETFELKIAEPTVYSITNPHLGSIWANTQTKNIVFSTYMVSNVNIEYSINDGSSWNNVASNLPVSNGENSFMWTISGVTGDNPNSLIRITDASSSATTTSENFTLLEIPLCEFTNPTASSTWIPGTQETISITNNDISDFTNIEIELYKGNDFVETLFAGITLNPGNNDLIWDVPSSYSNATNYSIKVIQNSNFELAVSESFSISYINNVSVLGKAFFKYPNLIYYSNIPILHKLPEMIYVTVNNLGSQAQTNFAVNIDLYEGETLVDTYTSNYTGTLLGGESVTLAYQFSNIMTFNNYSAGNTYKYEFNVELIGNDENLSDNTDIKSYNITNNLFTSHQLPTDHQATIAEYVGYGHPAIVNEFYLTATDRLDSIQIHINDVSGTTQIRPVVYDYYNLLYTGPVVDISGLDIGQTITIPCDFTFNDAGIYYIGIKHVNGMVKIPASQPLTCQYASSSLNYSWLTFDDFDWYLYENGTLALDIYIGGSGIVSSMGTNLCSNSDVSLTIVPFNDASSYQWYFEGEELIGETGESIMLDNITLEDAGEYSFTIDGADGASINLSVSETPTIAMLDELDVIEGIDITISPVVTGGSGTYQYEWSNSTTNNTLSLITSNNANYYLTVTDNVSSCQAFASIEINVQKARICMVTVDTSMVDSKNIIVWEKPETEVIVSYNIYKEVSTDVYEMIGSLDFDSDTEYIDMLSQPSVHADKYKITAVDTADNESLLSPYHQTMNLSKVPAGNGVVLFWNKYIDESGEFAPTNYHVYRGLDPDNLTLETSLSGGLSSYNYNILNAVENEYYLVSIQLAGTCNPISAKSGDVYTHSVSNFNRFDATELEMEIINNITIYPNPTNGLVNIELIDNDFTYQLINICSIDGKVVNTVDMHNKTSIILDMTGFAKGVYFINFYSNKGAIVKKLIIE